MRSEFLDDILIFFLFLTLRYSAKDRVILIFAHHTNEEHNQQHYHDVPLTEDVIESIFYRLHVSQQRLHLGDSHLEIDIHSNY